MMKRIVDIALAGTGMVVLAIPLLLIAVAVTLDSRGPAIFRQVRVGKGGRLFRIHKFRTMHVDAEKHGLQITVGGDSRVTKVGSFLRKTKLDELPQLLDVLFGNMSMVGPRPEVPLYVGRYSEAERKVLELKPGITDPASLLFRNEGELLASVSEPEELYVARIMPVKIRLNLKYGRRANLCIDTVIILKTVFALFGVKGR